MSATSRGAAFLLGAGVLSAVDLVAEDFFLDALGAGSCSSALAVALPVVWDAATLGGLAAVALEVLAAEVLAVVLDAALAGAAFSAVAVVFFLLEEDFFVPLASLASGWLLAAASAALRALLADLPDLRSSA